MIDSFDLLVVLFDEIAQSLAIDGFAMDFHHTDLKALIDCVVVDVGRNRSNHGWWCIVSPTSQFHCTSHSLVDFCLLVGKYSLCSHETIYFWHVQVHQHDLELGFAACL